MLTFWKPKTAEQIKHEELAKIECAIIEASIAAERAKARVDMLFAMRSKLHTLEWSDL